MFIKKISLFLLSEQINSVGLTEVAHDGRHDARGDDDNKGGCVELGFKNLDRNTDGSTCFTSGLGHTGIDLSRDIPLSYRGRVTCGLLCLG